MKLGLVIPASGIGSRFSSSSDKQLHSVNGLPMILRTLMAFESFGLIADVVVVTRLDLMDKMATLFKSQLKRPVRLIEGGHTRAESVKLGVMALDASVDTVMVHDAARPFLSTELIERLIKKAGQCDAIVPGVPVVDTVKRVENGVVIETVDRSSLRRIQTPQVFRRAVLNEAYEAQSDFTWTDESMLVECLGVPVYMVDGDLANIKVTYSSDVSSGESKE